jgi:hypothetical protein
MGRGSPQGVPDPDLKALLQPAQNHRHVVGLLPLLQKNNTRVDRRKEKRGMYNIANCPNVIQSTAHPSSTLGDERQSCGIVGISHDPSSNQLGFGQAE